MTDIQQAKRSLGRELRACDGFVGIGVGDDGIRLYAESETAPVVKMLRDRWGTTYEGFSISVVLSTGFKAEQRQSGAPVGQELLALSASAKHRTASEAAVSLCIEMNWPIRTLLTPKIGPKVFCDLRKARVQPSRYVSITDGCIRIRGMFECGARVLEDVRYWVVRRNGCLGIERLPPECPDPDGPTLLIMLESPHRDEYQPGSRPGSMMPIGPAQGGTGTAICRYLADILRKSKDVGTVPAGARVVIANPVPFQASLHAVHRKELAGSFARLRDAVWTSIWEVQEVREAFRTTMMQYNPHWIVSACTGGSDGWSGLKGQMSDWAYANGLGDRLYTAPHPGRNGWNGSTKFKKLRKIDINHACEASLKRSLIGVGPKVAHRIVDARPFARLCCLKGVEGIGDGMLDKNRWRITAGRSAVT